MKKSDLSCKMSKEQFTEKKVEMLYLAHPEDFHVYFDAIADGILSIPGCVLYYGEPGFAPTEAELKKAHIDYVVIPVGKGLLKADSEVSKLYAKLAEKQFRADNKNPVNVLPIFTVENKDLDRLPELTDLLKQQTRFTEIQRAYARAGKAEKKDMITLMTAFGFVKSLGTEDRFLKTSSAEALKAFAEKLDEKYHKLWTLQPLGWIVGSLGRYYEALFAMGSYKKETEELCLKDIEYSRKYAEMAGTDEGFAEVLPAYDYMIWYYMDNGKYRKAKPLAEASLEYRLTLVREKDLSAAKIGLTLAYYNLGEIEYNLKHNTKAKKCLEAALENADKNPGDDQSYTDGVKAEIKELLGKVGVVEPEKIRKVGVMIKMK